MALGLSRRGVGETGLKRVDIAMDVAEQGNDQEFSSAVAAFVPGANGFPQQMIASAMRGAGCAAAKVLHKTHKIYKMCMLYCSVNPEPRLSYFPFMIDRGHGVGFRQCRNFASSNISFRPSLIRMSPMSSNFPERGPAALKQLLQTQALDAVFQPIVSLADGAIIGYEGLIRGPAGHALESPGALFETAAAGGLLAELEAACRRTMTTRFVHRCLPGRLFINLLPSTVAEARASQFAILAFLQDLGLHPEQIVIEITESQPQLDLTELRASIAMLRSMGFEIAIDDVGEGFASLKLWSELRPEYVKIDKHFVRELQADSFKLQFVRAIQQISAFSGAHVIAEGIETADELRIIRDLGIEFGQGYLLGRPEMSPLLECDAAAMEVIRSGRIAVIASQPQPVSSSVTVGRLVAAVEAVTPLVTNAEVLARFERDQALSSIPVVLDGVPIGLIRRGRIIQEFALQFRRELFGRRLCTQYMENDPLIIEASRPIHEAGALVTEADRWHLSAGFIITEQGRYLGMGSGQALVRELTKLQITAARYSNPLTQLPGNVPIDEHVDRLLLAGVSFVSAYCDIDDFKPYNDVYGYRKGDEMIQMLARVLSDACDCPQDFIGHIGGDDFVLHLQSADWELRCRRALQQFEQNRNKLVNPSDLERRGYSAENRRGEPTFFPLPSLSIGAVVVVAGSYRSHQEIAAAMADAKKEAKRVAGGSLYIDRRNPPLLSLASNIKVL